MSLLYEKMIELKIEGIYPRMNFIFDLYKKLDMEYTLTQYNKLKGSEEVKKLEIPHGLEEVYFKKMKEDKEKKLTIASKLERRTGQVN